MDTWTRPRADVGQRPAVVACLLSGSAGPARPRAPRLARRGSRADLRRRPLRRTAHTRSGCLAAASAASGVEAWTSSGGGGGAKLTEDGGGGGGGGGGSGRDAPLGDGRAGEAGAEDVVLLDVRGMHCGGCSSRVGRLLSAQPHVAGASVSLATEVALVRVRLPPELASGTDGALLESDSPVRLWCAGEG